jgi:predicted nucleotidyltransferase
MNRGELSKALAEGKPALQAKGVQHLALFGSYARDDASLVDLADVANLLTDIPASRPTPSSVK